MSVWLDAVSKIAQELREELGPDYSVRQVVVTDYDRSASGSYSVDRRSFGRDVTITVSPSGTTLDLWVMGVEEEHLFGSDNARDMADEIVRLSR